MGKTARRIFMLLVACALAAPATTTAAEPGGATGGTSVPSFDPALFATPNVLVGKVARFRGTMPLHAAGSRITIERLDPVDQSWVAIASAPVGVDGTYLARWRADVTGRLRTRARIAGSATTSTSGGVSPAADAALEAALTVYKPAMASWYGPGFYGRTTACGARMTRTLLGVAHRRLPCGTEVALTYHGRSITVPVVDRGPFVKGRRWDLTSAAAEALGFEFTDRIGAVRVG